MEDTIIAVATCVGESSINIIRVSGSESIDIVNRIFSKDISKVNSHTIHYGFIMDGNEKIDEVLVSVFLSPKTFTRENIVEISVHGGKICVNKVIELLLNNGSRLAEAGEFLKRAFLNGRIDLTQAEAVGDLISAQSEFARKIAFRGVDKGLFNIISKLKEKVLALIANIEVNIDYPEYEDALIVTNDIVLDVINYVKKNVNILIDDSSKGIVIKNGIKVVLVGKPNVGKSSLLNKLLNEDKAIVTNIKGTTRDIIDGILMIDGVRLTLLDTAGIRESDDIVESIGVERSMKAINDADLVLFVIDSEIGFDNEDNNILKNINDKKVLVVYNKSDIKKYSNSLLNSYESINVSVNDEESINELKSKISDMFDLKNISDSNYMYISNARQISLLKRCSDIICDIENAINLNMEIDMIEIDVKRLWETLCEITGEVSKDDLLDEIFSKFCLGK